MTEPRSAQPRHIAKVDPDLGVAGVLSCGCCGEPLEVRCKHGHEPQPYGVLPPVRRRARGEPKPPNAPRLPGAPRTYKRKACRGCPKTFQPTGPRAQYCEDCR